MDYLIWTVIVTIITYILYVANKRRYYFKDLGIPQPYELPFVGISAENFILKKHISVILKEMYDLNKDAKYVGCHMFKNRVIVVRDLELIKSVLVKNFDHFAYRRSFVDENNDPLFGKNLAFINGDKWRDVRTLLSPAFTSSKMKGMFIPMLKCADNFSKQFINIFQNYDNIDTKDAFTRYTNDVIATCAFGIEIDSLKYPNNEFYIRGKKSTEFAKMSLTKLFFMNALPGLSAKLGLRLISKPDTDYFVNVIKTTIKTRKEQNITRPDMLQLMIDAPSKDNGDLDLMEVTAQAFIFFLGGFESTASQMCLMANELAANPEAQKKLQEEIDNVMKECNGKPTYEAVNNMPYLDAVFSETMRLYPVNFLGRLVSKDFELPPALPDSKPYTVTEGIEMFIPVSAIHRDPEYFDDPDTFNPDRFINKKIITSDITNLGFGMGPRMCIGNRFAILETKIMFLYLLSRCNLELSSKSPVPFEHQLFSFVPNAKNGFWLKIKPRQ